jgi:hypothetical protein
MSVRCTFVCAGEERREGGREGGADLELLVVEKGVLVGDAEEQPGEALEVLARRVGLAEEAAEEGAERGDACRRAPQSAWNVADNAAQALWHCTLLISSVSGRGSHQCRYRP